MFTSVLNTVTNNLSITAVGLCLLVSLVSGFIVALAYRQVSNTSKSFLTTIAILPAIVQMIILMVNGNLGVGVAVAGSFSLVRFRSLPGKASDILILFLAMGLGLCTGMGYIYFALTCAIILSIVYVAFAKLSILNQNNLYRNIRITIPEDLEYTEAFKDVFEQYTKKADIESIRTVNLGTMYQLNYDIELKKEDDEKKLLDSIRTRNGNLSVISSHMPTLQTEL